MSEESEFVRETQATSTRLPGKFTLDFLLFFGGIILPTVALVMELLWKPCAQNLFDPIPTWWHILLVAFVPVTNLQIYWMFVKGYTTRPLWISFANGVAIFIALFYAMAFAPILPLAVIAILALVGLLPLAPLFSLIAGIVIRFRLGSILPESASGRNQWLALAGAFLFVFTALGIAELNFTITRLGVKKANSNDPEIQRSGLELLRNYGDRDYLLRLSYDGPAVISSNFFSDLLSLRERMSEKDESISKQARMAFYRLTGKHYRQEPTPRGIRRWEAFDDRDEIDRNSDFRVRKGLSLAVSQIDGSVDPDAAVGYLEWTLIFKNESATAQEAIAQIQLPSDGMVSRLTLWINGEEREAAFGTSAKVTEAYDSVTATRRDPALVTLTGKDRVQIKCFPVPSGGEMKVRIGITAPTVLEDADSGLLTLPYFQSRNFAVSAEHSVWVESKRDLKLIHPGIRSERGAHHYGVRGRITDDDLNKHAPTIRLRRDPSVRTAWAKDTLNGGFIVRQELKELPRPRVRKLILIIDASVYLANDQSNIAEAIRQLPGELSTALVLSSGNGLNLEISAPNIFEGSAAESATKIERATFDGGTDAVTAIEKGWELANSAPGSAIVWIHGPQMVELESPARLSQLWSRRPTQIPIYSLQIGNGENRIERALNESDAVSTVPRLVNTSVDLASLFQDLVQDGNSFVAVRTIAGTSGSNRSIDQQPRNQSSEDKVTSQHLVRLWANDETRRLLRAGEDEKATKLAVQNQIVTRVSGAVVLETRAQYDQFGLKPVDANSVPTIPEPHEYLLFAVFIIVLVFLGRRLSRQVPAAV